MQALRIFENPETTSPLVQKLLAHWGGGSVLLGTGDGNLAILVSASAQPLRPWALGAAGGAGPAEEFLPGQLLLRRGESSWVARLTEGLMFSAVQNFLVSQNGKVLKHAQTLADSDSDWWTSTWCIPTPGLGLILGKWVCTTWFARIAVPLVIWHYSVISL